MILYIDPGVGSMAIQAALAAVLAVPFFFRTHVRRVIQRLRGTNGDEPGERTPRG